MAAINSTSFTNIILEMDRKLTKNREDVFLNLFRYLNCEDLLSFTETARTFKHLAVIRGEQAWSELMVYYAEKYHLGPECGMIEPAQNGKAGLIQVVQNIKAKLNKIDNLWGKIFKWQFDAMVSCWSKEQQERHPFEYDLWHKIWIERGFGKEEDFVFTAESDSLGALECLPNLEYAKCFEQEKTKIKFHQAEGVFDIADIHAIVQEWRRKNAAFESGKRLRKIAMLGYAVTIRRAVDNHVSLYGEDPDCSFSLFEEVLKNMTGEGCLHPRELNIKSAPEQLFAEYRFLQIRMASMALADYQCCIQAGFPKIARSTSTTPNADSVPVTPLFPTRLDIDQPALSIPAISTSTSGASVQYVISQATPPTAYPSSTLQTTPSISIVTTTGKPRSSVSTSARVAPVPLNQVIASSAWTDPNVPTVQPSRIKRYTPSSIRSKDENTHACCVIQ